MIPQLGSNALLGFELKPTTNLQIFGAAKAKACAFHLLLEVGSKSSNYIGMVRDHATTYYSFKSHSKSSYMTDRAGKKEPHTLILDILSVTRTVLKPIL